MVVSDLSSGISWTIQDRLVLSNTTEIILLKMEKILENLVISSHDHIAFSCSWSLNSIMQVYSILLILAFTLGYSENIILVIKCFFLTHLGIKFHFPYPQDQVLPNLICFSFYLRMSSMSISVLRFYINCIYKLMILKFTSLSQVFFFSIFHNIYAKFVAHVFNAYRKLLFLVKS